MRKIYVMDTNILIHAPEAILNFEDNEVVIPMAVLEELDGLKNSEKEKGRNAREAIRHLENLRVQGNLVAGVDTEQGGIIRIEKNYVDMQLPPDMPEDKMDNRSYTDHSQKHAVIVAERAAELLEVLGYSKREIELCKIAGFMHDIGNCVNRSDHAHSGAIMAMQILRSLGMDAEDISVVISAIGNHDEETGTAVNAVSAAIILADKTDVRRNRVRNKRKSSFDIHDRVNYGVLSTELAANPEKKEIHLNLELDEETCSILDYFEIFTERMLMCRRASEMLGMHFKFTVNERKVL